MTGWAERFCHVLFCLLALASPAVPGQDFDRLRRDFREPPREARPQTRWWWMGNCLRPQDIEFQLSEMNAKGIAGVEIISMPPVYQRGNAEFLSEEYFARLRHAVSVARRLGMEVSLNFGGPGWIWGGPWVPREDRNRNMVATAMELRGPRIYEGELPLDAVPNPRNPMEPFQRVRPEDRLLAVVAGEIEEQRFNEASLRELTALVRGRRIRWRVPPGRWRLMAFWQVLNETAGPTVDHLSKAAMERYCEYLGGKFKAALGQELGRTVTTVFMDSFEVPIYRNGLYWSEGFLAEFRRRKGYDLTRYLPALWFEVDDVAPRIRYDVNHFLHEMGMEAFFDTFVGWAERHGLKARIQPYGFVTDILEGAGRAHIPEMEITAGEKDAVPWFDTRIGPRVYTASGAHLYGRPIVSVEAYTYLHWEQGRDTLEELKIASDIFLRSGANLFFNHGYTGTPEMEFVPTRRFGAEMLISHVNVWWPYYRHLSDYVARACVMMRYGRPVADVAVYSPLANQWTRDVLNARRWTRDFDWGDLGKLLLANGWDFDLINDDVLQRHARFDGQAIRVSDLEYRVLILPNIEALPLESMERIEQYARGGGVVIALERIPQASTGFLGHAARDARVRELASRLFAQERYGAGRAYFLEKVMYRRDVLDWKASVFDPFLKILRAHIVPDVTRDFVRENIRENTGLLFAHRRGEEADVYFLTNVQDRPLESRLAFRVAGRQPHFWDPMDGSMRAAGEFEIAAHTTHIPVRLGPYASVFVVFTGEPDPRHVRVSNFHEVISATEALALRNGYYYADDRTYRVEGIPAPFEIAGPWRLKIGGVEKRLLHLESWTEDPATRHFSGTATYEARFELPADYLRPGMMVRLGLGDLGNVGEVELNGRPAGVIWMRGQSLDVTGFLKPGENLITVKVTNTLINRVAGWTREPPLPPELAAIYGGGVRDGWQGARNVYGFEPLPRSGLLGPVTLTAYKIVPL